MTAENVREYYRSQGAQAERERVSKFAIEWVNQLRSHDSDCSCGDDADAVESFIRNLYGGDPR